MRFARQSAQHSSRARRRGPRAGARARGGASGVAWSGGYREKRATPLKKRTPRVSFSIQWPHATPHEGNRHDARPVALPLRVRPCVACTAQKKGSGADGACAPIVAGSDPEDECVERAPATCGSTGVCDGKGACELFAGDTLCDDGDPCTEGDHCSGGGCGGERRACPAPDACHLDGYCDSATGACDYPLKNPEVTSCGTGDKEPGCACALPGAPATSSLAGALFACASLLARHRRRRGQRSIARSRPPESRWPPSNRRIRPASRGVLSSRSPTFRRSS